MLIVLDRNVRGGTDNHVVGGWRAVEERGFDNPKSRWIMHKPTEQSVQ